MSPVTDRFSHPAHGKHSKKHEKKAVTAGKSPPPLLIGGVTNTGPRTVPTKEKAEVNSSASGFDTRRLHHFPTNPHNMETPSMTYPALFSTYLGNHNPQNEEKNMNQSRYNDNSLDEMNSAPRCPVVLLLDVSDSMSGQPIDELNQGLRQFIRETAEDEAARMSVELEVITFESTASVAMPFTPICDVERDPAPLVPGGTTAMGAALRLAHKDLAERRRKYRNAGISSYKPWVVLMTDGGPNDNNWQDAAAQMRELGELGKIQYIGIEIGDSADHATMCQILPANPGPVKLQGLRFKQFFRWLTDSLRSVSSSAVSDENNIRLPGVRSWADLAGM